MGHRSARTGNGGFKAWVRRSMDLGKAEEISFDLY